MTKYYSLNKIITKGVLTGERLDSFKAFAESRLATKLHVVSKDEPSCYTFNEWYTGLTISLGRNFYAAAYGIQDDRVDVLSFRDTFKKVAETYVGVFYHEFFHLCYTPMEYTQSIYRKCNPSFINFAHNIVNILEDVTIEGTGMHQYPYSKKYIEGMKDIHFREDIIKDVSKCIEEDPESSSTFISFLLLLARGYDVSTLPEYKFYKDHEEFIKWGAYKCINTISGELRVRRQLAYASEIAKLLDFKTSKGDKGQVEKPGGDYTDTEGPSNTGTSHSRDTVTKISQTTTNTSNDVQNTPQETDDNIVNENLEPKEQTASRGDGSVGPEDLPESRMTQCDLTKENIHTLANDDPVSRYAHISDRLDKYINTK